jgi:hypothetical protein
MTLSASDPDVLDAQLLFHLHAGVEAIVVVGGEAKTLEAHDGSRVRAARAADDAREAIAQLDPDWVIDAAAGEFWWPRGATLAEILSKIPAEFGTVQAIVRPFLRVEGDVQPFEERTVYRLSAQAMLDDPTGSPRPTRRLAHRRVVDVSGYDDGLPGSELRPLRGWYPIEVLSLPLAGAMATRAEIERGLAEGVVQEDTRVRDALRTVRSAGELTFPRPTVVDNALFAVDAAVLGEADALRIRRDLDGMEQRLAELEENLAVRVERKLRKLVRGGRTSE